MHSGVDDEPACTPHFVGQLSEPGIVVGIEVDVAAETLRIKSPTLNVGRVTAVAAEVRKILQFLSSCDLQVMPWNRFVKSQRFHVVAGTGLGLVGVEGGIAGSGAMWRTGEVICRGVGWGGVVGGGARA